MTTELLIALTLELSRKKTKIGPELTTYMKGLAYCEKVLDLRNRCLDEALNYENCSGENIIPNQEFESDPPNNQF